jgi:hypothetical protein
MVCSVTFLITGCDGFTQVSGRVVDENGIPIKGAMISLQTVSENNKQQEIRPDGFEHREQITESDGAYNIGYSHAPFATKSQLIVKKEGFKDYQEMVTGSDIIDDHEIVLKQSDD